MRHLDKAYWHTGLVGQLGHLHQLGASLAQDWAGRIVLMAKDVGWQLCRVAGWVGRLRHFRWLYWFRPLMRKLNGVVFGL